MCPGPQSSLLHPGTAGKLRAVGIAVTMKYRVVTSGMPCLQCCGSTLAESESFLVALKLNFT